MAQISRPFQIAFVAVALLAGVWLFAFQGRSSNPAGSPAAVAPAAQGSSGAGNAGAPSSVYQGSAPGVGGLTRAIAKAHGAVATSQANAKQLEEKSAQASSASPATVSGAASAPSSTAAAPAPAASALAQSTAAARAKANPGSTAAASRQRAVEAQLAAGKIVVLLIWNPHGVDDAIVHQNLQHLAAVHRLYAHAKAPKSSNGLSIELNQPIAVEEATPGQVALFGSFTRDVQIYSTPTVLVINRGGQVRTLTGTPGILSLEQATDEARHP